MISREVDFRYNYNNITLMKIELESGLNSVKCAKNCAKQFRCLKIWAIKCTGLSYFGPPAMARDRRICCHDVLLYRTMSHSLLYNVCACVCTHGRTLIMYNSSCCRAKYNKHWMKTCTVRTITTSCWWLPTTSLFLRSAFRCSKRLCNLQPI